MKVAVLSVALLFTILLSPSADAKALLAGAQNDLREIDLVDVEILKTAQPPVVEKVVDLVREKRLAASLES